MSITGMTADLPVSFDAQTYGVAATSIKFDQIDIGFPLSGVAVGVSVADGIARLRDLGGSVLGGRFAASEFGYDIARDKASLEVELSDISLAEVLALEGGDVQGNGTLDGKLPITIDGDNFIVDNGTISARPPGGTLIYKGAAASSMVAQTGFGFAFKALEDFRYNTLDANVALASRWRVDARRPPARREPRGRGRPAHRIQPEPEREPDGVAREPARRGRASRIRSSSASLHERP